MSAASTWLPAIGNGDKAAYLLLHRRHATGRECSLEAGSTRSAVHLIHIYTYIPILMVIIVHIYIYIYTGYIINMILATIRVEGCNAWSCLL